MSESTVGKVVESMFKLRAEKDELNGRIKEINRALEELEYKAVRLMDEKVSQAYGYQMVRLHGK